MCQHQRGSALRNLFAVFRPCLAGVIYSELVVVYRTPMRHVWEVASLLSKAREATSGFPATGTSFTDGAVAPLVPDAGEFALTRELHRDGGSRT